MTSQRASSCLAPTFPGRERVLCAFLFLLCPLDRCERNAKAGPPRQHFGLCVRLSPCDHAEHAKSLLGKPREARAACATGTQLRRRGDRLDWSFAALGGRRAAVWRRVRTRAPGARRYLHVINIFLSATTPVRRPSFAPHASALLLCGRARSAAVYFQAFPSLPPSFLSLSLSVPSGASRDPIPLHWRFTEAAGGRTAKKLAFAKERGLLSALECSEARVLPLCCCPTGAHCGAEIRSGGRRGMEFGSARAL